MLMAYEYGLNICKFSSLNYFIFFKLLNVVPYTYIILVFTFIDFQIA